MKTRIKTNYPGVYYREAKRIGGKGVERVYYIIFKKDGKTLEEKVGRQYADDMTLARAARIRAERIEGKRLSRKEIRELKKSEKEKWTIAHLWEEYKKINPGIKGLTQDKNRFHNYIEPFFGKKEPSEILPLDVDRLRITLQKKLAPGTVKNILELLRRIINFGMKRNLCAFLNFKMIMPKVYNLKTEDLKPKQLEKLLGVLDKEPNINAVNIMRLALLTGMRKNELFKLQWDDVDFEKSFIHIREPKGGSDQTIPLNEGARQVLENHPRSESPFVFPGRGGKQRTDIKRTLKRIKERAGLPEDFRPLHGLRHVYASILASSGKVDLYTLQKLLTHKSPVMTQRYAHLRDETLKRASEVMSETINNLIGKKKVITIAE